ncbi:Dihydroorotate dehydrogenase (quinone), mitochondrial [Friedmanniomyces endolithicus]|nr:Dihydroorotate dehydrogenase (quinone), mitochondrial [Friedmanniomyces endolithicus]
MSEVLFSLVHRTFLPSQIINGPRQYRGMNRVVGAGAFLGGAAIYAYITDTRASIHQWAAVPALRLLHQDPEEAHHAGIRYIKGLYNFNLHPRERGGHDDGALKVEVFGHILDNPIGTSAGIDKNAEIPSPLFALGPAIVEVGGVTPHPQEGNPLPRVFRLPSQNALINRYGLNSEGVEHVAMQLRQRVRQFAYDHGLGLTPESERIILDGEAQVPPGSLVPGKLLAVQVAKNKFTPDSDIEAVANDYVTCVNQLAKYADILVVNVSSPNTPGLRDLQATGPLTAILSAVVDAAKATERRTKPAVMVKVSPDEDTDAQIDGICAAVWSSGVDGIIVGNTTKRRPDPIPKGYVMPAREEKLLTEMGGYSGPQMFGRTLDLVTRYRSKLDQGPPATSESPGTRPKSEEKDKVIFATGGITNGEQCLQILNAGASVCQIYTAMMYGGVGTVTRMKQEMREAMRREKA